MKELKLYISYSEPKFKNGDVSIQSVLREFIDKLLREFSGCTAYKARGWWINRETQQIEVDSVLVIEILTDSSIDDVRAIIESELRELKTVINQVCLLYSVKDAEYYFV